jgi:5-methylcytosine-specific restriction enzyme A
VVPQGANSPDLSDVDMNTGRELNEKWKAGVAHALYRRDGTWYHRLERFPGALFDANGYIRFDANSDLENCPGILIGKRANWLNVPDGIARLPGYVRIKPESGNGSG